MSRSVIAFAGHMIDARGRKEPRFPASAVDVVRDALRRELDRLRPAAGVTALASGADILFAEALVERGAEFHVLLPLAEKEFLRESVEPAGADWVERYHRMRATAKTFEVFGDAYYAGSGTPFQLTALLIDGTAQLLARERTLEAVTLAVWDRRPGDGMGGAASFVGHSVQQGRRVVGIYPQSGEPYTPGLEAIVAAQRHLWGVTQLNDTVLEHRLCAFLFADVKGFGGLRETEVPDFVQFVIARIAAAANALRSRPLVVNTWGDGLLVVTELPHDAADIALRLVDVTAPDSARFTFRVGLHCGPAFFIPRDPITGKSNVYGADVNLAARIEPVVTAGQVWASRSFVVMAAATGADGLDFADLGDVELSKKFGPRRLSRVLRAGAVGSISTGNK